MEDVYDLCADLWQNLSETENLEEKEKFVLQHLRTIIRKVKKIEDFRDGLEWFNVDSPLKLESDLKNKIVVLDFFTYCCINCLHILPVLRDLEDKYKIEDGLVVVGVHSAKFEAEKLDENVASAVSRHNIRHAVVNDVGARMWNVLDIFCWPTLLVLGPGNLPLFVLVGEGHAEVLDLVIRISLQFFKNEICIQPLAKLRPKHRLPPTSFLSHPGRAAVHEGTLAISDTGHHRVLLASSTSGQVFAVVGDGERGYQDGGLENARFDSPQGLIFLDAWTIFVADTENHAIREIDLKRRTVQTLACERGEGGTTLTSPWGLALTVTSEGSRVLLVSMAGVHQIWGYFLDSSRWWGGTSYERGSFVALVGSGREENFNNESAMKSSLAQPSGLAVSATRQLLLMADSESSTLRQISLVNGRVEPLVGGDRNFKNLFAFGDADGVGLDVKLQHPLDVAWSDDPRDEILYVADTFNNKVKVVTLENKKCETLVLKSENIQLKEPGGLCLDHRSGRMFICDTNNHSIRVVDLATKVMTNFPVYMASEADSSKSVARREKEWTTRVSKEEEVAGKELSIILVVRVRGEACKAELEAVHTWKLTLPDSWMCSTLKGTLEVTNDCKSLRSPEIKFATSPELCEGEVTLDARVVVCDSLAGQCRMENLRSRVKVTKKEDDQSKTNSSTIVFEFDI